MFKFPPPIDGVTVFQFDLAGAASPGVQAKKGKHGDLEGINSFQLIPKPLESVQPFP